MLTIFVVVLAFALGGLVHAAAGFGSALVAMPIATQVIGVRTAAPIEALLGFALAATVLYQNRHAVRWREAGRLIAASLVGVPFGTLALTRLPSSYVTGFLGIVLIGYGLFEVWSAARRSAATTREKPEDTPRPGSLAKWTGWVAGFFAGLLGGAYAANGPPLIIYGAAMRWPKHEFKFILQACFLVNGVFIVVCHGLSGLITRDVGWYCLYAFPGLVVGIFLGSRLDRHLNHERFRKLVAGLILVLGVFLIAGSFRS